MRWQDAVQRRRRRQPDQCHIQLARLYLRDQHFTFLYPQLELHLRVRLLEGGQHRHHVDVGERRNLTDRQQPAYFTTDGGHVGAQVAQAGQHLARMHQQRLTRGGRAYLARQALEQRRAQFLLQVGNLVAERGLHHVAALGGTGEVALLGQGHGEFELLEIHATISIPDDRDDDDSFPSWLQQADTVHPRFLEHRVSPTLPPLHRWQVLLMSVATGVAVASNYYAQPLLHTIADAFGMPFGQVGMVVTAAQLSYAAGLILLVPLGDLFERRRLIVVMSLLSAGGLVISACAPSLTWLLVGTAVTGMLSVVAQVLVPFAATLAAPHERGKAVGTVMSGLLLGILLARTVAGLLSSLGDWRLVYAIAAGTLVLTALALQRGLPRFHHSAGLGYFALLRSIGVLFVQEPVLRQRTLLGACSFAMFAIFWTPLAFLLAQPPYEYSDATIGLFGLVGAAGTLAAGLAGRMSDRGQTGRAACIALVLLLLSLAAASGLSAHSLLALLVGVVVLDLAAQLLHVGNQNSIYALQPAAHATGSMPAT